MIKNESKPQNKIVKNIKKVLLTLAILIFGPILAIIIYGTIDETITRNTDKARFTELDVEMTSIYDKLVTASAGVDEWKYEKDCQPTSEIIFWSGEYLCKTLISMNKPVVNLDEIRVMNDKYTTILKNNEKLSVTSGHGPALLPDTFETGGFDGSFSYDKLKITCLFNFTLLEKSMADDIKDKIWPKKLPIDKNGLVYVRLYCSDLSTVDLYVVD